MKFEKVSDKVVSPRLNERFALLLNQTLPTDLVDDDDVVETPSSLDTLSGLSLILQYQDAKQILSQRIVTCKQFQFKSSICYLKAFCHHRMAIRSFRIDRILEVYHPETGECLSPAESFFAQFTPDSIEQSKYGWGLSVQYKTDLLALLNALVFVARCDKQFHHAEAYVIERAVTSFWMRYEVRADCHIDEILSYSTGLAPDGEIFWVAMDRIKSNALLSRIFRQMVVQLIEADGIVNSQESYWAIAINDFFAEHDGN